MKGRKNYSVELKAVAVRMVNEQELSEDEVTRRILILKETIGSWVKTSKVVRNQQNLESKQ